ncbi:hypothetical protein ACROYT_G004283 [Oculina patagonica]
MFTSCCTQESYRQLKQRVESHVATFLSKQTWTDALPKNQVRDSLRKHINQSEVLERGIKQLISQSLDSKSKVFQTRIEGVVQNYIYTQGNPQATDKQNRKHKTVDEKDNTKSTSSDSKHNVISDISQLIPIPGPSTTVAKTTEAADKKLGAQDSSKSGTSSKGFQTIKKSSSGQGKSNVLAGRGEETRTASPVNEKVPSDEGSRAKEGKSKISRVKAESLSRDDGRLSPKVEENSHKVNKVTKVKVESTSRGESSASSLAEDKSKLIVQANNTSSSGEMNENSNPVHLLPAAEEMGFSQGDVTRLVEVKTEKGIESESFVSLENIVKVKEEKSETFGVSEQNERKNIPWQQKEEVKAGLGVKPLDDCGKQESENILLSEVSHIDTGAQRSDGFQTARNVEEMPQGQSGIKEKSSVNLTVSADESKMQESVERLEFVKESAENVVGVLDIKSDEKIAAKAGGVADSGALEHGGMKITDLPTTQGCTEKVVEELPSVVKTEAGEVITTSDEIQRQTLLEQSRELHSRLEEDPVESEPSLGKLSSVVQSLTREDLGQVSSTGEYSDGESDISEVSSVHTSDLSSFDEEITSVSESYDEDEETREGEAAEKRERGSDDDKETTMPQSQQDPNAPPKRRSTRISSRRSTKEGDSEVSENETSRKESRDSSHKRRHSEKRNKKPRPKTVKEQGVPGIDKPRRRGRPRKDERRASSHADSQIRRSRTHDREDSSTAVERSGSDSRKSRSTRSQRQIKRTRCYSPSSEGTREVFLPRKRSRDDPI